ncbi:hypothetical protein FB459_2051 [Yimella lutea]|uniref:Uncharacterized protein n=1 Tax=Yimella lutea TaxID=587872 RepID=A0A542EGW6_9MICO|nr:hypothetical protein [Yimella lutea]TQJ14583.1 hypothetical protein FB459_2051 [Yimella lutea]
MSVIHSDSQLLDGVPAHQLCGEHLGLEAFVPRTDDHPTMMFGWQLITQITHRQGGKVSLCVADSGDVLHLLEPGDRIRIRVPLPKAA